MDELQILAHAKNYMDKLAQGINPLTGEPIPEDELINNVRISRCFFYVSDVLGKVLEHGGIEVVTARRRSKSSDLPPFHITQEALRSFEYSDEPILVTHIANRVNTLVDTESMKKLSASTILKWLNSIGMVEEVKTETGRKSKRPTVQGNAIGIAVEFRNGHNGAYQAVTYNRQA